MYLASLCGRANRTGCELRQLYIGCSRKADRKVEGQRGDTKVFNHVEVENKRVKEVTDAIMYDLLPAAIASATQEIDEVPQELTWELCQVSYSCT